MTDIEQKNQISEYHRRCALGLNPDPLIERVDLISLAGEERYRNAVLCEEIKDTTYSLIRDINLQFYVPSRRLLWQALGQEYIEPDQLDFIDHIPDDAIYYDVGASNGLFAVYAAATRKKVYCFEPDASNYFLLSYNSFLNHQCFRHPLKFFNVALTDEGGIGSIYIEKFEVGGHLKILDQPIKRCDRKFTPDFVQPTLKYRMDDFIDFTGLEKPEYIKIDVDGSEKKILSGMQNTLGYDGLKKIFIELDESGEQFEYCKSVLEYYDFRIESHKRVQNYFGEENFVFSRN